MVASQIARVRGGGKAYRYGGEEFTVVFASSNISEAIGYLDEVRTSIQDYAMVIRGQSRPQTAAKRIQKLRKRGSFRNANTKVSVTISIGVACKDIRQELPEDVLARADQALYKAKKAGRNRVTA
jgi:PleD family two-component response regulator